MLTFENDEWNNPTFLEGLHLENNQKINQNHMMGMYRNFNCKNNDNRLLYKLSSLLNDQQIPAVIFGGSICEFF